MTWFLAAPDLSGPASDPIQVLLCALSSLPVCVNPGSAFNCYWEMPFRTHCRMTVENLNPKDPHDGNRGTVSLYYQVNYTLTEVPADAAYFHAQWRRSNPLPTTPFPKLADRDALEVI